MRQPGRPWVNGTQAMTHPTRKLARQGCARRAVSSWIKRTAGGFRSMAHEFYVQIDFTKQGKNKGESLRTAHKDKITGLSFEYELLVPTDAATGHPSGKRQHKPIVI